FSYSRAKQFEKVNAVYFKKNQMENKFDISSYNAISLSFLVTLLNNVVGNIPLKWAMIKLVIPGTTRRFPFLTPSKAARATVLDSITPADLKSRTFCIPAAL